MSVVIEHEIQDTSILAIAEFVARRYMERADPDPGYQNDLCLQGLLCLHQRTARPEYLDYVIQTLRHRGSLPSDSLNWQILFTDIHSELWRHTGDSRFMDGWLEDLETYDRHLPRDASGRIVFFKEPERQRLLIDMLQGYCLRMARAGAFTGNQAYYGYAAGQYLRYAEVLVNPDNGLWHHGRGWDTDDPEALSPEGWCRGQAWVVRGLVESLAVIPETLWAHHELHRLLIDLVTALLRFQGRDGMWHQVVQEPNYTYPETSGTGMIVYYLSKAWVNGWLSGPACLDSLRRAQSALRHFVDDRGRVYNGCPHSPPRGRPIDYIVMPPDIDDRHAVAAMMMALSVDL